MERNKKIWPMCRKKKPKTIPEEAQKLELFDKGFK